jgi:hypothetical protein
LFAECSTLGKEELYRVSLFAECLALGKAFFVECETLPSAALGKEVLCQVPDILHSAKHIALDKDAVCGSECSMILWATGMHAISASYCEYCTL